MRKVPGAQGAATLWGADPRESCIDREGNGPLVSTRRRTVDWMKIIRCHDSRRLGKRAAQRRRFSRERISISLMRKRRETAPPLDRKSPTPRSLQTKRESPPHSCTSFGGKQASRPKCRQSPPPRSPPESSASFRAAQSVHSRGQLIGVLGHAGNTRRCFNMAAGDIRGLLRLTAIGQKRSSTK